MEEDIDVETVSLQGYFSAPMPPEVPKEDATEQ